MIATGTPEGPMILKLPQSIKERAMDSKEHNPHTDTQPETLKYQGHEGGVNTTKFLSPTEMLTGCADWTAAYWDVETRAMMSSFRDHDGDVTSIAFVDSEGQNSRSFFTGSCDCTAKQWDFRKP